MYYYRAVSWGSGNTGGTKEFSPPSTNFRVVSLMLYTSGNYENITIKSLKIGQKEVISNVNAAFTSKDPSKELEINSELFPKSTEVTMDISKPSADTVIAVLKLSDK